jgi:branched-chain amino acid transport system permease protein
MGAGLLRKLAMMAIPGVIIPILFRLLGQTYVVYVMTLILFWAYLAQCWNIVWGYAGLLSFGHAAFLGIGAYVSTLLFLNYGLTPWIGMFVGGVAAISLALLIGYPTLRLRGVYFALATIAVAEMVRLLTLKLDFITGGSLGLLLPITRSPLLFQFDDILHWYLTALVMLLVLSAVSHSIENSKLGMALRAVKGEEDAAASVGIYPFKYKMMALLLSAFFTAIGGTFFAQLTGYIRPDIILTVERSEEILTIALVGGTGTFIGPIIGAIILLSLRQTILALLGGGYAGVHLVIYGILIILVVRFMPGGVYQYLRSGLGKIWR